MLSPSMLATPVGAAPDTASALDWMKSAEIPVPATVMATLLSEASEATWSVHPIVVACRDSAVSKPGMLATGRPLARGSDALVSVPVSTRLVTIPITTALLAIAWLPPVLSVPAVPLSVLVVLVIVLPPRSCAAPAADHSNNAATATALHPRPHSASIRFIVDSVKKMRKKGCADSKGAYTLITASLLGGK